MEVVTGALPSVVTKLAELVAGEYHLQKGLKGEIRFLQDELESMKAALMKVSNTPADQLDIQDKIWARNVREMSYDIGDSIDKFMVQCKSKRLAEQHGLKKVIDRSLNLLMQPKIRHKIATEIQEIKSRVMEVCGRRRRYEVSLGVDKPVPVDPRLFTQYTDVKELVGIDEARDELIHILMEETAEPASKQQDKIVSIVGFGGLGKTTLANVVYEKLKAQFECSAFVSVSQTLDQEKLLKDMFYQLAKQTNESTNVTRELREFLQNKRYFIVIDDIWNVSDWKIIKCALPDNNVGNKMITTTRILNIAEQVGGAYKLQPISLCNSRKLFFSRIFGNENQDNNKGIEECPDNELAEVSERILKKCAGVPLAIITMASMLACKPRNKMEWYEVYNSIGTGLENNLDVENMRKILSFSYYELPCYLRTCLLYLSIFPEDFEIDKGCLIRMWISEGFIQCEKQGKSLYEIGESYFTELINRNMIMPVYIEYDLIYRCRVHDMVLDLIRSLSSEESFVTVLNDMDGTSPSNKIRRLSLQSGEKNHILDLATISLQHTRSAVVFQSGVAQVVAPSSYGVLRVLELRYCNLSSQANCLKHLENLYHLRYLGLQGTNISQLPEEIGNLQFLQTLDASGNEISRLPSAIVQLKNLMFLYIDSSTRVPNGIGNLTCLEQLSWLGIDDSNIMVIEELGQLTELRRLCIQLDEQIELDEQSDKLLECLCKLQKIQELLVVAKPGYYRNISGLDTWVAPRNLREFRTISSCWFSTLPAWMHPSLLLDLTTLHIAVRELHQADLEILGRLPALRSLRLQLDHVRLGILRRFVIDAGSFPCLVYCEFNGFVWPVIFQQGAMPRLRELYLLPLYVRETRGITSSDGGLDLGLGNLPSLQDVEGILECEGASRKEAEQARAALRNEAEMHPNHPFSIYIVDRDTGRWIGSDSDEDDD